jgi:hypothetical protein
MRLTKKWFIVLLILWPVLFGLGVWDGEYAMSVVTGFGVTLSAYYEQQLSKLDKETNVTIRAAVNQSLVTWFGVGLMLVFIIGVFFFDEPRVPLLDTIYLVLGIGLTLNGLFIRSAYRDGLSDTSNAIRH